MIDLLSPSPPSPLCLPLPFVQTVCLRLRQGWSDWLGEMQSCIQTGYMVSTRFFFTSSKFLSPYSTGILCSIIVVISLVTVLLSDPLNFQQSSRFNLCSFAGRVNRWESPTPAPLPFTLALLQGCGNVVGAKDVCDAHFPPSRTE